MREQLIKYVDLLFAGVPNSGEMKQEILQNTLDRFDDLINQGKSPESAYRLAISGIGDVNEILNQSNPTPKLPPYEANDSNTKPSGSSSRRIMRAIAIGLYILCPLPLFILQNELGLCGLLIIVSIATVLTVLAGKQEGAVDENNTRKSTKRNIAKGILWGCCIALYVNLNMNTEAFYLTWLIFPICACIQGIITACFDLKEER